MIRSSAVLLPASAAACGEGFGYWRIDIGSAKALKGHFRAMGTGEDDAGLTTPRFCREVRPLVDTTALAAAFDV
jgi:hypothetical protein